MSQLKIRVSQLNTFAHCCGAFTQPECLNIGTRSEEAEMGTDAHREFAKFVRTDEAPDWANLNENIRIPVSNAWSMWDKSLGTMNEVEYLALREFFPDPEVEQELDTSIFAGIRSLSDIKITGHPDVFCFQSANEEIEAYDLNILDWKAGYIIRDYLPQKIGYAWLAMLKYPGIDVRHVNLIDAYPRLDKGTRFMSWRYSPNEINKMMMELMDKIKTYDGKSFTVGLDSHCTYCPLRTYGCDAYNRTVQSALVSLNRTEANLMQTNPISLYKSMGEVAKQAAAIRESMKQDLLAGIKRQEDGEELYLADSNDKVVSSVVIPELQKTYPDAEILAQCSINKGGVQKLAKDNAPKGQKGTEAQAIVEAMREIGGIIKSGDGTVKTRPIQIEVKQDGK